MRYMKVADLVQHYGSQAEAARALRVTPQVVNRWKARQSIPDGWQEAIERATNGVLRRDIEAGPQ